jgi:SAM-dependent methyltransferase
MNKEFWNERYSANEFVYGIEPNDFLKSQSFSIGSNILCLAEGEGRNGVYLARQGHAVKCIDFSEEAIKKTQLLAKRNNVNIQTECLDLNELELEPNSLDGIVIIFGHFPMDLRKKVHQQLYSALKPKGKLIIEAYSKEQIHRNTGGPRSLDLLYSYEELASDFLEFLTFEISEIEREVNEGSFHQGQANVIRFVGIK